MNKFNFGIAVELLKEGYRVHRSGWNGKDMYLELQVPDSGSKMSRPYIYMKTVNGEFVPWVASQSDILEEDWVQYEDVSHLLEEKSIDQHREEFEEAKNIAYRSENGIFDAWEAWKAAKGITEWN